MKYFSELAYNGTNYCGWQRQSNGLSVQEILEDAFSTILQKEIAITGCGRTDAGVHASQFFIHFDFDAKFPVGFINRINKFLPKDISVISLMEVTSDAHARYDAYHRSYEYHISFHKNPFQINTIYYYPFAKGLDLALMQQSADLLLNYDSFFPFCKSNSDAKTMFCELRRAEWVLNQEQKTLVFHISANRFLRGMVRLIVGMCLNVGNGKLAVEDVKMAMEKQVRLKKDLSVAARGLYLTEVKYPNIGTRSNTVHPS